jgi:hypothetical protein
MGHGLLAHRAEADDEPLSPELALVDPELAERARRRLREQPPSATGDAMADAREDGQAQRIAARARPIDSLGEPSVRERLLAAGADGELLLTRPATPDDVPSPSAEPDRRPPRRRLRRAVAALVLVGAAAAAVGFLLGARPFVATDGPSGNGATSADETSAPHTAPVQRTTGSHKRARARPQSPPEAPQPPPEPPQPPPEAPPARAKPRPPAPRVIPATRTFVWPANPRATFYRMELIKGGRTVFQASPATPRLTLPASWIYGGRRFRLTPGTYEWRVRPAFGRQRPRLGAPITSSKWIVR